MEREKDTRVSFEQVIAEIKEGRFSESETNTARPEQFRIIVKLSGYPYVVPFVITASGGWLLNDKRTV